MTRENNILDSIDTDGVTVEDVKNAPMRDRPAFSIPAAIAWARDPKNAPKIEEVAREARVAQDQFMHRLDDRLTEVKDLFVDVLMNDETESDLVSDFLSSITGVK